MGCVPGDPRCSSDEQPRHAVTLSKPFDLMTTEVTVGMFKSHGFHLEQQPIWSQSDNHPVVVVTWSEANDFCAKIGGRLPTEAEWERAARGGQEGVLYPWGDKAPTDAAGATNGAAFEGDAAQPVGQYAPNAFGVLRPGGKRLGMGVRLGEQLSLRGRHRPQGQRIGPRCGWCGAAATATTRATCACRTAPPTQPDRVNLNVGFRCARDAR